MNNIKTPEEIAQSITDKYYSTNVALKGSPAYKEMREFIISKVVESLSAERNANLEKIKGLEEANKELGEGMDFKVDEVIKLESQLATANAKIVELEKQMGIWGVDRQFFMRKNLELQSSLTTANKKAEKLVEALEGVVRVADRETTEFKAAKEAIKKYGEAK